MIYCLVELHTVTNSSNNAPCPCASGQDVSPSRCHLTIGSEGGSKLLLSAHNCICFTLCDYMFQQIHAPADCQ